MVFVKINGFQIVKTCFSFLIISLIIVYVVHPLSFKVNFDFDLFFLFQNIIIFVALLILHYLASLIINYKAKYMFILLAIANYILIALVFFVIAKILLTIK